MRVGKKKLRVGLMWWSSLGTSSWTSLMAVRVMVKLGSYNNLPKNLIRLGRWGSTPAGLTGKLTTSAYI